MTAFEWKAYKNPVVGSDVELDDIQTVSINMGRVGIQDPFRAGVATIRGRNPQNLPTLDIGDNIYLQAVSGVSGQFIYFGQVANFRVEYGETQNQDIWILDLEDGIAKAGRAFTSSSFSWSAGIRTSLAAFQAAANCNISLINVRTTIGYVSEGQSFVSAQSLPNLNLLNILNTLAMTEQGRIVQNSYDDVGWINRSDLGQYGAGVSFTDGSLTATYNTVAFSNVQFSSLADSFYDSVLIQPDGLASQLSGSGDRRFTAGTYDQTTTQAANLADYVLATLDVQDAVPLTVSALDVAQSSTTLLSFLALARQGVRAELILRGTRYNLIVEGFTVSAQPGMTRVTFNVVSSEAQNFFILDSTTFGVLDSSRLGF